jgi:hypothetical protein
MPLSRKPAPFDHPEYLFELKYDGFRSLAVIQNGRCQLISRNGHPFNSFTELRKELTAPGDGRTVIDGEIVCLDRRGRPQFNDLLFHRREPCFFVFDLLMSDGKDVRSERLTDRKIELRRLLSKAHTSRMRYVEHVEQYGIALFERVCKRSTSGRRGSKSRIGITPRWRDGSRMTYCQIEFVSSDSDVGTPCSRPAVTNCADCGVAICSDCRLECCGDSFCEPCYDYHVTQFLLAEACAE